MDPTINKNIQFSDSSNSDTDYANMPAGQDLADWDLLTSQDIEPAKKRKNTEDDTQSEGINIYHEELWNPAKKIKISLPGSEDLFMSETLNEPGPSGWQQGQSQQFMSEALSHPGASTGEQDPQFKNDDSSMQVHYNSASERELPQTPEAY